MKSMTGSNRDFQVLDTLDSREITSQRQLSEKTGISLGQINYVLKRLIEKGWIKIGNFKKNPSKIGYAYLLTPRGIEAKSRLAIRFVMGRLKEYQELRYRLSGKMAEIQNQGHVRFVFIGPDLVKDLIHSIINDKNLKLEMVYHTSSIHSLEEVYPDAFDVALWFDDSFEKLCHIPGKLGIVPEKMMPLW